MVRDSAGAFDGWYWGYAGVKPSPQPALEYPNSGFGLYCTRCHASAESELTFSAVRNVDPAQDPLSFVVQTFTTVDSVGRTAAAHVPAPRRDVLSIHGEVDHAAETSRHALPKPLSAPDPAFLDNYHRRAFATPHRGRRPVETRKWCPARGPEQFITSDHAPVATRRDLQHGSSPQRARHLQTVAVRRVAGSLMASPARPRLHAQRESEVARFPTRRRFIDTMLQGPGVGQAGHHRRHDVPPRHGVRTPCTAGNTALERDGISCMSCHQISAVAGRHGDYGRFRSIPGETVHGP